MKLKVEIYGTTISNAINKLEGREVYSAGDEISSYAIAEHLEKILENKDNVKLLSKEFGISPKKTVSKGFFGLKEYDIDLEFWENFITVMKRISDD